MLPKIPHNWTWPKYKIPGLKDENEWNLREYRYPFGKVKYSACHSLGSLAAWMTYHLQHNIKFDVMRFGDGEMLLLNNKIKGNLNGDDMYFYNSDPIKNKDEIFIDFNKNDLLEFDKRCSNFFTENNQ